MDCILALTRPLTQLEEKTPGRCKNRPFKTVCWSSLARLEIEIEGNAMLHVDEDEA